MRLIEIDDNRNCVGTERVFHDVEPPQSVTQVRLAREDRSACWYEVVGWTTENQPCPAFMQKVDDSGAGVCFLVFGGTAGLRFRSAGSNIPWSDEDTAQWGEPFLLLADVEDIRERT